MTDRHQPEESAQPQFRSRRERREHERALRGDQSHTSDPEHTELVGNAPVESSETAWRPAGEASTAQDLIRPEPVAADGPGGLRSVPPRPTVAEPGSQHVEQLEQLPEDTRDYPGDLGSIDESTRAEDTESEDKPLGYMLIGEKPLPLPDMDEDQLKTRKTRKRRGIVVMLTSFAVFLGLLAIVGIGVGKLVGFNNKDFPGPGGSEIAFEVNPGEGPIIIGNRLVEENIVASTSAFRDAVEATNSTTEIQPGEYVLRYEMPARDAADVLLRVGVSGMNYVHVNSGHRIDDVYEHLADRTDYTVAEIEEAADPGNYAVPADAQTLEGYVAVGEYHFPFDASVQEIFEIMIEPTMTEFDRLGVSDPEEQHRLVTVASIVEAEALPEDYATVAGIIENRLDSSNTETNGYLQIDATVIYGMGVRQLQFSSEDRQDASNAYNTYAHPGLPPGPIGAPSIRALDAAADPTDSDYYYWITTNIETGETKFSETYAQHQQYQAEYRAYCDDHSDICGRG